MYKMHPDDIRARNIDFLVHGKLTPWVETLTDLPEWSRSHSFPCAQPDILTMAREQFLVSWPSDGQPLDIEGLEAAFALAMKPKAPEPRRDCGRCGTTLGRSSLARGLCGRCSRQRNEEKKGQALDLHDQKHVNALVKGKLEHIHRVQSMIPALQDHRQAVEEIQRMKQEIAQLMRVPAPMAPLEDGAQYIETPYGVEKVVPFGPPPRRSMDHVQRHERIVGQSLPMGGRSYIRAAQAAGLRHTLCHDGVEWYIDCHDGTSRQPEAAWNWLLAQREIYHVAKCESRLGKDPCGMACRKQRQKAGVTLDDYNRTV